MKRYLEVLFVALLFIPGVVVAQSDVTEKYDWAQYITTNDIWLVNEGGKVDEQGNLNGGLFGILDGKGNVIFEPQFSYISPIDSLGNFWINSGARLYIPSGQLESVFSNYAKSVADPIKLAQKRDELESEESGGYKDALGRRITGGKYGYANINGKIIIPALYTKVAENFSDGLAWIQKGKKYGYVDVMGNSITPIQYMYAEDFCYGAAKVSLKGKSYSLIDASGSIILEGCSDCGMLDDNFGFVNNSGSFSFINGLGKVISSQTYNGIGFYKDGVIICRQGRKLGYISNDGQPITPCMFTKADDFTNGVAIVQLSEADAVINKKGEQLRVASSSSGKNTKMGVIDYSGLPITDFIYTKIYVPSDSSICLVSDSETRWIDYSGNYLFENSYKQGLPFFNGRAAVCENSKFGFINKAGDVVIPLQYNDILVEWVEDFAVVKNEDKWGAVNQFNEYVITPLFDNSQDVVDLIKQSKMNNKSLPLTLREVQVFKIKRMNSKIRHSLNSIIGDEYWEY